MSTENKERFDEYDISRARQEAIMMTIPYRKRLRALIIVSVLSTVVQLLVSFVFSLPFNGLLNIVFIMTATRVLESRLRESMLHVLFFALLFGFSIWVYSLYGDLTSSPRQRDVLNDLPVVLLGIVLIYTLVYLAKRIITKDAIKEVF